MIPPYGNGVDVDEAISQGGAALLYEQAAEQGLAKAQYCTV
jgi:hypothetical protein